MLSHALKRQLNKPRQAAVGRCARAWLICLFLIQGLLTATAAAANRLIEVKHTQAGGTLVRSTAYTWDLADNLTAWTDTDHGRNQTSSAALTYDAAERKTQEAITYPSGAKLKKTWDRLPCAVNSFPADTVVHAKPQGASLQDAQQAQATLKAISQLQVGDEVLAIAEWKDKGTASQQDQRLSYEKVTDFFTSYKEQTLIHLTLASGEQLTATEGHPFKTLEGWRDAVMLKKGGKLLLKGGDETSEPAVEITDIQTERKTLPVYNIEVANAHTYFVGIDGVGVHNGRCTPWKDLKPFKGKTKTDGKKLYEKDYTHKDMEVYDKRGNHLGSADMSTGEMTKPPVPGRTIRR
jgi:YD repeat-containing protein